MKFVIKIIYFKVLLIILFGTNLNSKPVILLQTDNQLPKVDINVKIPTLVLEEIESQFPYLHMVDDSNFYNNSKWSILKEWQTESASQLYMLEIVIKNEYSSLEKLELTIFLYKYRLERNSKLTYDDAIELMSHNPNIEPLIIDFLCIRTGAEIDKIINESFIMINKLKELIANISYTIVFLNKVTRETKEYEIRYKIIFTKFYENIKDIKDYKNNLFQYKEKLTLYKNSTEAGNLERDTTLQSAIEELKKMIELPWEMFLDLHKTLLSIMNPLNVISNIPEFKKRFKTKIKFDIKVMGIDEIDEDDLSENVILEIPDRLEYLNTNSLENEFSNMETHLDN